MTSFFPPEVVYDRGLCVGQPHPNLWDEPGEVRIVHSGKKPAQATIEQVENAKALCRKCPALAPCRQWVIRILDTNQTDELIGTVCGGLDSEDRRQYLRDGRIGGVA